MHLHLRQLTFERQLSRSRAIAHNNDISVLVPSCSDNATKEQTRTLRTRKSLGVAARTWLQILGLSAVKTWHSGRRWSPDRHRTRLLQNRFRKDEALESSLCDITNCRRSHTLLLENLNSTDGESTAREHVFTMAPAENAS